MSTQEWKRLIRFTNDAGNETFGEPLVSSDLELEQQYASGELHAVEMEGSSPYGPLVKGDKIHVKSLGPILRPSDVPIIRCIGLNYMKHIKEGGRAPPPYPSVFIKPSTSIAAHDEDIPIPSIAQDGTLDYEGELAIVIGRSGKDIAKADALSHVAGYLAANDVSARGWQRDPKKAGGVPQWCFSKGFDKFAPLSPMLVSPAIVGGASDLHLRTVVNGEERQNTSTGDLLFGVEEIISFISQGTTIEEGTVILTGTPSGVAMGMKEPKYLSNGDVVEVSIGGLGRVSNKMVFA